jgi:hypothetical protein
VHVEGEEWTARGAVAPVDEPVPLLLAALGPRLVPYPGLSVDESMAQCLPINVALVLQK